MLQLETDAEPRPASGKRVKAASRASGSAPALALTRDPGVATVKKGGKKRSTSNTVAEPGSERPCRMRQAPSARARRGAASLRQAQGRLFDTALRAGSR